MHTHYYRSTTSRPAPILEFWNEFEKCYGNKAITPNMHLQSHLKDIIIDHGPVYSFWCFSFEMYNGIMECVSTHKTALELHLMIKLILSSFLDIVQLPSQYRTEFEYLLPNPSSSNVTISNPLYYIAGVFPATVRPFIG